MVDMIITIVQILLLGTIGFFITYLAFLTMMAFLERNGKSFKTEYDRDFAIIVPAYNEEKCIARTLKNLQNVNYPNEKYTIFVIADNCTDNTEEIAKREGAQVMVRNNPEKQGKGYALRWCVDQFNDNDLSSKYDAAVVIDADTIVSENLLQVMGRYIEDGAEVVQGYLAVDSDAGIWTSEIISIGFTLYNYIRPLGRRAIGCSAGLRGNGMCFSMEVLKKVPWDAYSLTEDLEYSIKLLLNDVNVIFAPEAIGFNVVPQKPENAESQRERWEIGRLPVLKKYFGKLLKETWLRRSFKIFDALVDLVTPPLVNMMAVAFIMAGASLLFWLFGVVSTLLWFKLWILVIGLGFFHALLGLYAAGVNWSTYKSLIYVPRYVLWKLYIYAKVIFSTGKTTEWIRTSRESN